MAVPGSGKSVCTNVIINGLLSYNVELYLIDYKVCELAPYRTIRQCKLFEYEEEKITEALTNILDIIKQEYQQLLSEGKTHSNKYSTVKVLVIEELAQASKEDLKLLSKIASIGRAVNWRIVATIQRGDAVTLTPQLKCHFTNKICFKTSDTNNSKVVIDSDVCAYIKQIGRGYYLKDGNLIQFQGFYILESQIKETIDKNKKKTINDKVKAEPKNEDANVMACVNKANVNDKVENEDWINQL